MKQLNVTRAGFSEIVSFLGTDLGDPTSSAAEKPPKSARHVVTLEWSWSPMHSRTSKYRIERDETRHGWHLYETSKDFDSGKNISSRVVSGYGVEEMTALEAARTLLQQAWTSEADLWEFDPSSARLIKPGILSESDVDDVVESVELITSMHWMREQSSASFNALLEYWPSMTVDQRIDFAEEFESCTNDLELPKDYLLLCSHYGISPPSLLVLASHLIAETTEFRVKRELQAEQNILELREEIDTLVSELANTTVRGGGITMPSFQSSVRHFLERYVGENGTLPSGQHKIRSTSKESFDFDELRRRYGL